LFVSASEEEEEDYEPTQRGKVQDPVYPSNTNMYVLEDWVFHGTIMGGLTE
jgi:hypothetical protein